ncbi:MAG: hypothetical protein JRI59_09550 [Deltaproteobacteria bacterium]|nr:hypothetical protein [Deltaproteobacteria bacterium]
MKQQQLYEEGAPGLQRTMTVMLEIRGNEAQGSMRLPVTVHALDNGQVVLRLGHSLPEFMRDFLIRLDAKLYLAVPEEPEILEAAGKVAWLKISGSGRPQTLALELCRPSRKFLEHLEGLVVHSPADIKELWQRWDEAVHQDVGGEPLNYHIGLGLMAAGIILNLAGPRTGLSLQGSYLLMLLGGLVAGVKNLIPLRWKRAKSL